jgi:hypothetical protein
MNFFQRLFKKVEAPQKTVSDETLGTLTFIDLKFRGQFWETAHKDIKLLIPYDGVNKTPTEEVLALVRTTIQSDWLDSSLSSTIDLALKQNPVEHHEKINAFSINSLSFTNEGKIFIGLCNENLWFADFQEGKVNKVWLDV